MTISTLLLILLLTFGAASALDRFVRSHRLHEALTHCAIEHSSIQTGWRLSPGVLSGLSEINESQDFGGGISGWGVEQSNSNPTSAGTGACRLLDVDEHLGAVPSTGGETVARPTWLRFCRWAQSCG